MINKYQMGLKAVLEERGLNPKIEVCSQLTHYLASTKINPDKVELRSILKTRDPQPESLAQSFKNEMQSGGMGGRLYSESLGNILAVHLLRHYCAFRPSLQEYKGRLSRYNSLLDREIRLTDLAAVAGMSEYHFSRLFKQSMGMAPYQYVIQQQVEQAKRLLKQRDGAVASVAHECGFKSQSHLSRHFRQLTSVTPQKYQQQ